MSFLLLIPSSGWCDLITLQNGDQLTGKILEESDEALTFQHDVLGVLTLPAQGIKTQIREAQIPPTETEKAVEWKRDIAVGYNVSQGNTEREQLSGDLLLNRKTKDNEWTLKANGYYATSSEKMDAQKYSGLLRYAFSFGGNLAWYNFYKVEGDHDRFSNVDWRLTPSGGVGYWFLDKPSWKWMVEVGAGWEQTAFRDTTSSRGEIILVPRTFFEKTLFGQSTLSEDFKVWPRVDGFEEYRLRSETRFTHPMTQGVSLRLTFVDEFQSDPAANADRNDLRLTSSLVLSF